MRIRQEYIPQVGDRVRYERGAVDWLVTDVGQEPPLTGTRTEPQWVVSLARPFSVTRTAGPRHGVPARGLELVSR